MSRRRKKAKQTLEYQDAELNIMPFIDVFSVLNTFLLLSATFVAFGTIKVQVPYFSNKQTEDKPKRSLSVKAEIERDKVTLTSEFSMPPANTDKQVYALDAAGLTAMHSKLVQIRQQNPDTDLVTVFTEDDVIYDDVIKTIDAIKHPREGDPKFTNTDPDDKDVSNVGFVFPKVVMGSVIL
jgi:biopolymer transport protein ExbD